MMMMKDPEAAFVRECLRRYYYKRFSAVEIPDDTHQREFGYRKVDSGMIRHVQLKTKGDLRLLLMQEAPLDVYVSNARYLFPSLPMNEKMWQNADVIFDIDAKDLNLECRPSHTVHVCGDCGRGAAGFRCGQCGSGKVSSVSLPCDSCIKHAKKEVKKLLDMLNEDFGINQEGIRVYFSGNEGFHVHVTGSQFGELKSRERSDLADYIMFRGITPEALGMQKNKPASASLPDISEKGWRGRFAREAFGSKSGRAKKASKIISAGYGAFASMLSGMSDALGVRIDPGVTMDVHRVFRMPGTVNGKSGMTKVPCADIDSFNPYRKAVLMPGEDALVRALCPTRFQLNGQRYGPYDDEQVEVPAHAAVYMVCKGLARMANTP